MSPPQANFQRNQQAAHDQDEHDELRSLAFAHGLCLPAHGSSVPSAPSGGPYGTSTRRSIGRMPYSTTKSTRRLPVAPAAPPYQERCVGTVSADAPEGRHADGVGLPEEDPITIG